MDQPARRLTIGVAASAAVHTALVLGLVPTAVPAHYAEPQALMVELRPAAPAEATVAVAVDRPTEHAAPQATLPEPAASRTSAPGSAPALALASLDLDIDRYYKASEVDVRAQPINDVQLIYPKAAYEMRLKGRVVLSILINEHGTIDALSVVEADPSGFFEDHALAATRALTFSPAMKNGRAVKSQKRIEVTFDPYESINVP